MLVHLLIAVLKVRIVESLFNLNCIFYNFVSTVILTGKEFSYVNQRNILQINNCYATDKLNMVKRKSVPKKAPESPSKRRKTRTRMYKVGTRDFKVSVTTLRAIKKLQSTTTLCIPRLPFSRLIREILMEYGSNHNRIQVEALMALQEAAEMYLTYLFEDANRCAHHARRVTVGPKDIRLVLEIKGCSDPGYQI